ncbi:hypothetical protein APR08_002029 [Nocardia amikacinitolerans]|nr:hypothetical protein [Nocardia amikacinitolerans]
MRGICDGHHVHRSATGGERCRGATSRRGPPTQPGPKTEQVRSSNQTRGAANPKSATATAGNSDATTRRGGGPTRRRNKATQQGDEAALPRRGELARRPPDEAARRQRREGTTAASGATAQRRDSTVERRDIRPLASHSPGREHESANYPRVPQYPSEIPCDHGIHIGSFSEYIVSLPEYGRSLLLSSLLDESYCVAVFSVTRVTPDPCRNSNPARAGPHGGSDAQR